MTIEEKIKILEFENKQLKQQLNKYRYSENESIAFYINEYQTLISELKKAKKEYEDLVQEELIIKSEYQNILDLLLTRMK